MPINPAIRDLVPDAQRWRREIHANPELLYDLPRTSAFVADRLREFGCDEVRTAIGKSGVVGVIKGHKGDGTRAIGLRADMDALPIEEATNLPYRSNVTGMRPRNASCARTRQCPKLGTDTIARLPIRSICSSTTRGRRVACRVWDRIT